MDLGITDTDKYCYIMTYSFPCQDLSVAGKGAGMTKGSGTRSGLLWEVERLLNEVEELPQILLMENVPQVHGKKNIDDFNQWLNSLEWKGYKNYYQDLNAKDYGVAQSRNRCFCVSVLGNKGYEFPKPILLTKTMKDYLEDEVDEKYYIKSDKARELIDKLVVGGKIKPNLTGGGRDRQLTFAQRIPEQSNQQIVSKQDTMPELATCKRTEVESVNTLGFIEKGTGQHQSNTVYGSDRLSPTLNAVNYKEPVKVVECKKIECP